MGPLTSTTSSAPVVHIAFKHVPSRASVLFAVTTNAVNCHTLPDDDEPQSECLETQGCAFGCAANSSHSRNLVVARPEAIFFYDYDGQHIAPGGCVAIEGAKTRIASVDGYLLVVGPDATATAVVEAPRGSRPPPRADICSIYDLENKFKAMQTTFRHGVKHVLREWGTVVVITGENRVWQLAEKDTPTKLELLFAKHLYEVAAELAQRANYDVAAVGEIFRMHGDHQYEKGDYEGAMSQYMKTIGQGVEPSYVIQRFLDAQAGGSGRVDNLIRYLKRLHELGRAASSLAARVLRKVHAFFFLFETRFIRTKTESQHKHTPRSFVSRPGGLCSI